MHHQQQQQCLLEEKNYRIIKPVQKIPTQLEYVAQPGIRITEVVDADMIGHVVAVEPFAKVGESYGVLDEDCVIL